MIYDFVVAAWEKVGADAIKSEFLHAGISNAMDESQDDFDEALNAV